MHKSRRSDRKPWGKRIAIFVGVIAALLVIGYVVVTSSPFIKAVILPKVGAAINATVTAENVSLSPFSRMELHDLRVQTTGTEPLLTAKEARVRYSLMRILKGDLEVKEFTVDTPVLQIVQEVDGSSNLDPILQSQGDDDSGPDSEDASNISVQNVALKNGTVRQVRKLAGGGSELTQLQDLNLTLDKLGNGQSGKLMLTSGLLMELQNGPTNDSLRGSVSGGYDIALNQQLLPQTVSGSMTLQVAQADGAYAELAGFTGVMEADVTPKELRRVALTFSKGGQRLGEVRASGPFDFDRLEGDVRLEVLSLDKNVLALATAGQGIDFRETKINSTNQVTISQGGTFFAATGSLLGGKMGISQGGMVTPEVDVTLQYQATVNTADESATLQRLDLEGSYGGRRFLTTTLDRQMNLSWGESVKGYRDAALSLTLTNLNLADWRAVAGTNVSAGVVNANVTLTAQNDGRLLRTLVDGRVAGLYARFGTNLVQNADLLLQTEATVEQMKIVEVSRYAFTLSEAQREVFQGNGAARYDLESNDVKAHLTARGELPALLRFGSVEGLAASDGRVEVTANYTETAGKKRALGAASVASLTGQYDTWRFENYRVTAEYDVAMDGPKVDLNRLALIFSQGFNAGGSIDITGRYDLETEAGQFTYKTTQLNENALQPLLAPSLGQNELVSISVNSSGNATLDPRGENIVQSSVKIDNWVVRDSAGTLPSKPLAAEVKLDAGMRDTVFDLRSFVLKLSPTARARNELQVNGKLDFATNNATPSSLSIRAESLDVTPYYDMFAGGTNDASATTVADAPASSGEPEPVPLPFQQLAADLKIDQFYLHDVAISNWTGSVEMRANVLNLRSFKFDLNGGQVGANVTLDTSTPGYKYDVGLEASNVPLEPLVNTFKPAMSNQLSGNLLSQIRVSGAGVTGPNLRRNLAGEFELNLTNLNYEIVGPKLRRIVVPISVALRVPEITQTPVNWTFANAKIASGVVELKKLAVQSEAFYAESAGPITLNDVITNSTLNLPLELSLRRSLAEKARILPSNTPTNAKYALLPRFVGVKGTIGAPEVDINELAVAGILARSAAGFGLGNERAEQALGAVGNLLTGQRGTNAAGTNTSPVGNILQNVGGLLGGSRDTNKTASSTNAPGTNSPSRLSPFDLLRGLQKENKN